MKTMNRICVLAVAVAACGMQPGWAQEALATPPSKQVVPGLTYGKCSALPTPRCILFSCTPDQIIADGKEWAKRGINAFFLESGAREWSSDIWGVDKKPWTIGPSDETFQKCKKANELCKRIGSETFLKIAFDHKFDWFNDAEWQQIDNNFHQFAIFARDTGCAGIAVDIEYVGDQYHFEWKGYTYKGYTREDLVKKIRDRMTGMIRAMYDEFPGMVFLTFPEPSLTFSSVIDTAWVEEAARRNAPGGVHICTEGTYRNPNINYMFGRSWMENDLFQRLLSARAKQYWIKKCSIAEGVWPFGFNNESVHDAGMTYAQYRQGFAAALMASPRYMWVYSHNSKEQLIGRGHAEHMTDAALAKYRDVMTIKDMVTTPKYVAIAKDLRAMKLRDYSKELGIAPMVRLMGPDDSPTLGLGPVDTVPRAMWGSLWNVGLKYYRGEVADLGSLYHTQTHWMLIGPFPSDAKLSGHFKVFPPERTIDLNGEYDGVNGKVKWQEHRQAGTNAFVDLTKVFKPTEDVTAYALSYVTSPRKQRVQVRVGTNDAGKVWVGGKEVFDNPNESSAYLDDHVIPVTLAKGTTPILVKVTNEQRGWCFVFRLTGMAGNPLKDVTYSVRPKQ